MKRNTSADNRLDCILILALVLAIAISPLVSFGRQCEELHSEVLRLHILANSDSEQDQQVKLAVRDAVLEGTEELLGSAADLADAEQLAADNLLQIEQLARDELISLGQPPVVYAELANMYFDTRTYPTGTLPAGRYDAVRLTIGSGGGRNWWCVVFPPICVESAAKEKTELADKVESLGERPDYKLAFASVELVESLRERLKENPANP